MSVERLVVELRRDLIGYLQRKGQTIEDAEDVVQEAFVRFHRAGHDLSGADARPLLFVIARNLQTDRWKSAGRKGVRGTDDIHALDAGPRAVASDAPAADQHLIGRENLAAAARIIRALPPRTRDAFLLKKFSVSHAVVLARIPRLVFGAWDPKAGACGSVLNVVQEPRFNHRVAPEGGILGPECGDLLRRFFGRLRRVDSPDGDS